MKNPDLYVEILDTTLRDGEQTPGVAFTPKEKLSIAKMLRRLKVDRIEIGSARVSEGEAEGVTDCSKCLNVREVFRTFLQS